MNWDNRSCGEKGCELTHLLYVDEETQEVVGDVSGPLAFGLWEAQHRGRALGRFQTDEAAMSRLAAAHESCGAADLPFDPRQFVKWWCRRVPRCYSCTPPAPAAARWRWWNTCGNPLCLRKAVDRGSVAPEEAPRPITLWRTARYIAANELHCMAARVAGEFWCGKVDLPGQPREEKRAWLN